MQKALHVWSAEEIMDVSWCVGVNDYDSEQYLHTPQSKEAEFTLSPNSFNGAHQLGHQQH
jgi:hypothetical protein